MPPEQDLPNLVIRIGALEAELERIRVLIDGDWNGTDRVEGVRDWVREWRISNDSAKAAAAEARNAVKASEKQAREAKEQFRNSALIGVITGFFTIASVILSAFLTRSALAANQATFLNHVR